MLDEYHLFLGKEVELLANKYRTSVLQVAPELLLGIYPSPGTDWVKNSISRGFGTVDRPVIIFGTDTYGGGGYQKIPENPKFFYKDKGVEALYLAGFLLRSYDHQNLAFNLVSASEKCSGYWLFRMPMLWGVYGPRESLASGTIPEYWSSISNANKEIRNMNLGRKQDLGK